MNEQPSTWLRATLQRRQVSLHENVLARLANLLFETDELLDTVRSADAKPLWWTEAHLQLVYDEVNGLMKKLTD